MPHPLIDHAELTAAGFISFGVAVPYCLIFLWLALQRLLALVKAMLATILRYKSERRLLP